MSLMTEVLELAVALVIGLAVGTAYFGGLWLTLQAVPKSRHPTLLMVVSYLLRLALVLGAMVPAVLRGRQELAVAGLVGFVVVRLLVTRL